MQLGARGKVETAYITVMQLILQYVLTAFVHTKDASPILRTDTFWRSGQLSGSS